MSHKLSRRHIRNLWAILISFHLLPVASISISHYWFLSYAYAPCYDWERKLCNFSVCRCSSVLLIMIRRTIRMSWKKVGFFWSAVTESTKDGIVFYWICLFSERQHFQKELRYLSATDSRPDYKSTVIEIASRDRYGSPFIGKVNWESFLTDHFYCHFGMGHWRVIVKLQ